MSKSKGAGNRMSRISVIQQETGELPEELERKYLMIIQKNIIPNVVAEEAEALNKLAAQYLINKKILGGVLEEF